MQLCYVLNLAAKFISAFDVKNGHFEFKLHLVTLDILWWKFNEVQSKCPVQERIRIVGTTNTDVKLLFFQNRNSFFIEDIECKWHFLSLRFHRLNISRGTFRSSRNIAKTGNLGVKITENPCSSYSIQLIVKKKTLPGKHVRETWKQISEHSAH